MPALPSVSQPAVFAMVSERSNFARGRPRVRRADAVLEVQVGGVLDRYADAAPPVCRAPLDDVVEPRLPDLGGRDVRPVVGERAQEGEGARHVVVGEDERVVPLGRLDRGMAGDVP